MPVLQTQSLTPTLRQPVMTRHPQPMPGKSPLLTGGLSAPVPGQPVRFGNLGKAVAQLIDTGYGKLGEMVHGAASEVINTTTRIGHRVFMGPTQVKILDKVGDAANLAAILLVPATYLLNPAAGPKAIVVALLATALNAGKNHGLPN